MKRRRALRYGLSAPVWVLAGLLLFLLTTQAGLRALWRLAEPRLPEGTRIAQIEGSLLGGIRARDVLIDSPGARVRIATAELVWDPLELLSSRITLDRLRLSGLTVGTRPPPPQPEEEPPSEPLRLPGLPALVVRQFAIDDFALGPEGEEALQWLRLRGRLAHQRGQLALRISEFARPDTPVLQARLQAQLAPQSLQIETLRLAPQEGPGALSLTGAVQWSPRLQARLNLDMQDFDARPLHPEAPQGLAGQAEIALEQAADGAWQLRAREVAIDGLWRGEALRLRVPELAYAEGRLQLPQLLARLGQAELRAEGRVGDELDLDATLRIPALAALLPQAQGQVQLDIRARGRPQAPDLQLQGEVSGLQAAGVQAESARIEGRLALAPKGRSDLRLTLRELRAGGQNLPQLSLRAQGPREALRLQLQTRIAPLALQAQALADLAQPQQPRLRLDALRLEPLDSPAWSLSRSGWIRRAGAGWQVPEHCLQSAPAELCLRLDASDPQGLRGALALQSLPLERIAAVLALQARVEGEASLRGEFALGAEPPRVQADLDISPVRVWVDRDGEPLTLLALEAGGGAVAHGPTGTRAQLRLPAADAAGLGLQLEADAQGAIQTCELSLELADLEILSLLSAEVAEAAGRLSLQAQAQGTLTEPALSAALSLREGSLLLATPNVRYEAIELELAGDLEQLSLRGGMQGGPGSVRWEGTLQPQSRAGEVRIEGERLLLMDSELAQVLVSPELQLRLREQQLRIGGTVKVPEAHIHPESLPDSGDAYIPPTRDEVLEGSEVEATLAEAGIEVITDVRVVLGDRVGFTGFGLTSEISGALRVRVEGDRPPTATGELVLVDGAYKAYGQDLRIDRGRIIFSGGRISEPGIDLRASRKPREDITVGVQARGTAARPEVTLWSNPDMAQTEQLSWLLLGRSGRGRSDEDQAAMQGAALALGLKGSDFLANRFKGKLGLDEVSIGSRPGEQSSQAALVLGKYLNPRLYVSYGIGLFEPVYSLRLRYEISEKWTLQTESGAESGGDLVYTIER